MNYCLTCQTRASKSLATEAKQTLRVTVCDKQVTALAMMAPRMEKGSMVYTTNTMNRKKET